MYGVVSPGTCPQLVEMQRIIFSFDCDRAPNLNSFEIFALGFNSI